MCAVSNVHDHYATRWPIDKTDIYDAFGPSSPFKALLPLAREKSALELFEEIIGLTKKLDAILGLPDCESAHKTEWVEAIRQRIRDHESAKVEKRLGA